MSSGNDGEWVRQGTPRDADWDDEQSEYGTAVSPAEWNDYTPEQSVQVTPPNARPRVEEAEEEPTTRVVLSDPRAAHAYPEGGPGAEDTSVLTPMPAPQGAERAAPARAAQTPGSPEVPDNLTAPAPVEAEGPAARRMPQAPSPIEPEAPAPAAESATPEVVDQPEPQAAIPVEDEVTTTQEVPLFSEPGTPAAEPVVEERVRPRPIVPEAEETTTVVPADVFRDGAEARTEVIGEPVPEPTAAMAVVPEEELDAERRLEEQVAAERAARNERLGVVATSQQDEVRAPQAVPTRVTDKFLPSLGLMFLRLVVAGILGVIGYQILTAPEATAERLATTVVPQPQLMTWVLGFTLGGIALFLVIGLMVRVVGLLMLVLSIGSLALYRWGAFSPFLPGVEGFSGDRDLLLGAVGLLFVAVGGGGWGIDGAFRRGRARAKEERTS
ncbi:MAG: DoxX family membrane protein [Arachnia propionica]|uniref:DoxX family protein n=1 Tax=Arachnia propionica TaxID=1750 RepID=UPI0027011215|nr:DoxX family membrane protein [Arachnia propionica]